MGDIKGSVGGGDWEFEVGFMLCFFLIVVYGIKVRYEGFGIKVFLDKSS